MKPILPTYLARHAAEELTAHEPVSPDLGIGVVIPCYNEPDLVVCLNSLHAATPPECDVEVLVLVNAPIDASPQALARNHQTEQEVLRLAREVNSKGFRILCLNKILDSGKYAGVGLARRIGMDEMVYRMAAIGNSRGLIVSLDADCRVEKNYFTEIEKHLYRNPKALSATFDFEHPLPDAADAPALRRAMIQYELYLRYYKHALKYIGFPYPYYTIGSDFAVRAETYCRAGGMGKYQGGEDFYFLQKVFPLGGVIEINTTKVYPAARLSDRVPFGTGPSLIKLVKQVGEIKETYTWESFRWLRALFAEKERMYRKTASEIETVWKAISIDGKVFPQPLLHYLKDNRFDEALEELGNNCASATVFSKRFFHCFNALRVLQSLNALQECYPLQPVAEEVPSLLKEMYGEEAGDEDAFFLLERMRKYY